MNEFTELEVLPPVTFSRVVEEVTITHKGDKPATFTGVYDPKVNCLMFPNKDQEITIYPPPRWIMSPRMKVYLAKDIYRFRGYIKRVDFVKMVEGEPTLEITITPKEEIAQPRV